MELSNIFLVPSPNDGNFNKNLKRPIIFGFIGKLTVAKGAILAIEAFLAVRERIPNSTLLVAGSNAEPDVRRALDAAMKSNPDSIFELGQVAGDEKNDFFRKISILLFPSTYLNETQGIVNLEALSFGVPIIGIFRLCTASDLAESGSIGFKTAELFRAGAPDAMINLAKEIDAAANCAAARFAELRLRMFSEVDQLATVLGENK